MFIDSRAKCDAHIFLYEQSEIRTKNGVATELPCVMKEALSVFLNENEESMVSWTPRANSG